MSVSSELNVESHKTVMEFLRTELSVALIFASLAEGQRKSGYGEAAKRSLADAEKSYSALLHFFRNQIVRS